MSQLADLDHDGRPEIVALEDNDEQRAGAQRLAVYKMTGNTFRRHAETGRRGRTSPSFCPVRNNDQLELDMTTRHRCSAGGEPDTVAVEYRVSGRRHPALDSPLRALLP